jgi:uncharacterized protein (DUF2225 family)
MFIFLSSIVLILLYTPSFFFVKYKNDTLNSQLESNKQKSISKGEDSLIFIKNVNTLSSVFSDNTLSGLSYSDIIKKVTYLKNSDIKIISIVMIKENQVGDKKILVSGIATNRDSLSLYERDIKIDGTFDSVTFPVSNFIKSSDLEFSVTLIYKNK